MPSLKLFQRNPDRPSLRQRAEALKATAARVIRRRRPLPAPGSEEGESAAALIAAIKAEWATYGAMEAETADPASEAAHDAAFERLSALLKAAAALPVDAHGAILAKALALAWIEHTELWESGRSRDDYATDGRLVFDIHAAIMGAPAEPRSDDADLLALEAEFLAADAALLRAAEAMEAAGLSYPPPPMPDALRVTSFDLMNGAIPQTRMIDIGGGKCRAQPFGEEEVETLRREPCMGVFIGGTGGEKLPGGGYRRPDKRAQERADAIIAAWDGWQAQIRAVREAADLPRLENECETADEARSAVLRTIREAPAVDIIGLAVKARVAANMFGDDDLRAEAATHDPEDTDGLLYAIAADVLALTGGAPDAHKASA